MYTDRCTTCHLGLNEASLADVTQQPFRKHPVVPHSLDGFGCVICHGGQGAATTVGEAHHSERAGEEPILPARYIEAGCGQCHQNALPGTPQLNLWQSLARTLTDACTATPSCGRISSRMMATDRPPSPDAHRRQNNAQLDNHLAEVPRPMRHQQRCPTTNSAMQTRRISAYLVEQQRPAAGDTAVASIKPAALNGSRPRGAGLYGESFCSSCHAVQNAAGNLVERRRRPGSGTDGNKAKPEWLAAWLDDPRVYDATAPMPHYQLRHRRLLRWLLIYRASRIQTTVRGSIWMPQTQTRCPRTKTRRRAGMRGMPRINGVQKPENFAPELSTLGSKPPAQIVFLPGMDHSLPGYIGAKIRQPRAFGASARDAAVHPDSCADRRSDHRPARTNKPCPFNARQFAVGRDFRTRLINLPDTQAG